MKDHLESLNWLWRSMAPKPGTGQFFWKGHSHYPALGVAAQRKRRGKDSNSTHANQEAETDLSRRELLQETRTIDFVHINVFISIPLLHVLPEMQMFYLSTIVNQLKCMGIHVIATELAKQNLPLAGGVQHFLPNWAQIT